MMLDLLNLIATSVLAVAAVVIARNANSISQNANELADHSNQISKQAIRLEADKQLIEWGQRVLGCASSLVSLRILTKDEICQDAFTQKRRELRAALYALKGEGELLFRISGNHGEGECPNALKAIDDLTKLANGEHFQFPVSKNDNDGVWKLQKEIRTFISDIQGRVSDHWVR